MATLWRPEALELSYCQKNGTYWEPTRQQIASGTIRTMDDLLESVDQWMKLEQLPAVAAPVTKRRVGNSTKTSQRDRCRKGDHGNHTAATCWLLHPELRPANNNNNHNEATASEYDDLPAVPAGRDVFIVNARVHGVATQLGLDSMAALNLVRADVVPPRVALKAGGPTLHGIGCAEVKGRVEMTVTLGKLAFPNVEFAVVEDLPVPALLGKPTLTAMEATLDLANNVAEVGVAGGGRTEVQAVVLAVGAVWSARPQAQAYWSWLNKRLAEAPKRLQTIFQDVVEWADNETLEEFPEWALRRRQASGEDDPRLHPAPYKDELKRPDVRTTGLVVCPTVVAAQDMLARADDSRDFLPPIMTFAEEDKKVDKEMVQIVAEAELSENGKLELKRILEKHRSAFGMQIRKVNFNQEPVHTYTTGELPAMQPRRLIRDVRVRNAQMEWEHAMEERGVIRPLTSATPEKVRPINIHHVIRDGKIRFYGRRTHAERGDDRRLVSGTVADGGARQISAQRNVFDI